MNFFSNISLTYRSTVAVVSSLWNQDSIIADIEGILFRNPGHKEWTEIEKNVLSSLRKLELPVELKLNLENFVQPMGLQILSWILRTAVSFQDYPHLSKEIMFIWTENGTLDYSKTTRLIIESNPDKALCFCLACIFCIEDIILKLWPDVCNIVYEKAVSYSSEYIFLTYWVHYLNDEVEELMTLTEYCGIKNIYEFAFLLTLDSKCIPSLCYFLQQIQPEKRQRLIILALQQIFQSPGKYLCDGNLIFFLFSYLKESDINQMKSENSYRVLLSLLNWPYQQFFMTDLIVLNKNLSNSDYQNLFQDIVEYVSKYHVGNVYKDLIKQFWQFSPPSFKKYAINKCISGSFLSRIFQYENTDDIVQMIFNNCSSKEKQLMIFYFEGMNICDLLVTKRRWQSLKLIIKGCISSPAVLEEFIEQYKSYKSYYFRNRVELRTDVLFKKIREWY